LPDKSSILILALTGLAISAGSAAYGLNGAQPDKHTFSSPLSEFVEACQKLNNVERVRKNLSRQGWRPISLAENRVIATVIKEWESGPLAQSAEKRSEHQAFAKDFMGREILLLIKDFDVPTSSAIPRWTTCEMFDFAPAPSLGELHEVFGKQRVEKRHEPYFPDATPGTLLGITWHAPFGLGGATMTTVKTIPAEYYGVEYANYSAVKWAAPVNAGDPKMPPIPPPPPITVRPTPPS
jgi:hypothetical protein